jgi:hypothetical protein
MSATVHTPQASSNRELPTATTGESARVQPQAKAERDARVDFFRGIALLFIFIDHIPGNALAQFTLTNFGFADAAEIFVALAGYAAFLAYGKTFEQDGIAAGATRVAGRIRDLYLAHLVLLCVCVGGLAIAARTFHNPVYFEHVNLTPFNFDPAGAIWRAMLLVYQPGYLNILPLYMLLLAWFVVLLWLMPRHAILAVLASFAVWLGANALHWNPPSYPTDYGWVFNPFAWQLLFTLGVLCAAFASREVRPRRSRPLFWIALAYVLVALLIAAPWTKLPGLRDAGFFSTDLRTSISKQNLSLWRVAHIAALAYLAVALIPRQARWLERPWAQSIIHCGRHSLPIFCLGIVLSMTAFVVLVETGSGLAMQMFVNVAGIAIMGLTAWKLAQLKRAKAPAAPASASGWAAWPLSWH